VYPIIFEWGPFTLRTFGLLFALGFAAAIWAILRRSKRWGFPADPILTLCFMAIFSGILGARLAYVVLHTEEFAGRWLAAINPFAGEQFGLAGLNLYGGIVVGLLVAIGYTYRRNLSPWAALDLLAPGVAIGIFVARWGCFFNGCCFGLPSDLPWSVSFPPGTLPHYVFGSTPLHPAQIYSSLYGLVLFFILILVDNRKKRFGTTVAVFLMLESLFRTALEPLRYYESAMHFHAVGYDFTYNELVSALLFVIGLVLLIWYLPRHGEPAEFKRYRFGKR
jgi:phosphatidylglycerol:prolipoprotein diacylglycerol transferase